MKKIISTVLVLTIIFSTMATESFASSKNTSYDKEKLIQQFEYLDKIELDEALSKIDFNQDTKQVIKINNDFELIVEVNNEILSNVTSEETLTSMTSKTVQQQTSDVSLTISSSLFNISLYQITTYGTFQFDGNSCEAIDSDATHNIYYPGWSNTDESSSYASNYAKGYWKFLYTPNIGFSKTSSHVLFLYCDKDGNLSASS